MGTRKSKLEQKVLQTISEYELIEKNDKIIIGVSGGPDSMCLLDCLFCLKDELKIQIYVAHINHMLRKEAKEETKYVQEFCDKINVPVFVKYADINKMAKDNKMGTEEMGRKVRYEFFNEVAKKVDANKIATAHNSNDNAETVLMNLIRGSGTSGLKGIDIKNGYYIRPLRQCDRIEIEKYCQKRKLNPKIDSSNLEKIYTRNKIRLELIPYLQKEFNPNIINSLNNLSNIAREENDYFNKTANKVYETLKIGENEKEIILDLKKFNDVPKVIKQKTIIYTINKITGTIKGIEKIKVEDIIKLSRNGISNKCLHLNKNIKVYIEKGKIIFTYIK